MVRAFAMWAMICFGAGSALAADSVADATLKAKAMAIQPAASTPAEPPAKYDCKQFAQYGVNAVLPQECMTPERVAANEQSKAACEKRGGTWGAFGLQPVYECLMPYADAGKTCHKNSECVSKMCDTVFEKGKPVPVTDHGECMRLPYRGDVIPNLFDKSGAN